VRDRHADAVARSLESLRERHWFDPRAPVPELVGELLPEARAAFAHATSTCQWEVAGRIIGALTAYRHREGGHDEARRWLVAVLPHLSPLTEPTRAAVLFDHGFNCWHHDEIDRARDAWEEAVARFEALDDRRWLAHALVCSAMAHNGLDDQGRRRGADLSRRGIELAREIGPPALVATVLIVAGEFSRTIDDYPSAVARYEEAAQIAETVGDRIVLSVAVANLSYVASHDGDYATARRLGGRGLQLALEAGRRQLAAWSVSELAEPALGLGEPELAARLIGAAERSLHVMGGRIYPGDVPAHERVIAGVVEALGGDGYDRCYADGAAMSFDESVELALRWASADLQAEPQR
jgi:tetratricopeptide (TPR) repeat protein